MDCGGGRGVECIWKKLFDIVKLREDCCDGVFFNVRRVNDGKL